MNRISINEPCHENWSAMTPSEKGAFCGKCQIDVIDFSGKSAEDVKLILQENAGKHLCGRFKKTQLDDLNASYVEWDNQSVKVFQSKFLYACLVVFGMTLFSCNAPDEMILGEISSPYFQPDTSQNEIVPDSADTHQTVVNNTTESVLPPQNNEWKHVKGKVDYNYYENEFIKGDIAYEPDPVYLTGDTTVIDSVPDNSQSQITCRFGSAEENSQEQNNESVNTENKTSSTLFSAKVYPNPTGMISTIEIDIKETGNFTIDLISMNGERIIQIYSGELPAGISNHRIDLSVYSTGTYFVRVSSGNQTEICKILKVE